MREKRASGSPERVPTLMVFALANGAAINFRIDNQGPFSPRVRARPLREETDAIKREIAFSLENDFSVKRV